MEEFTPFANNAVDIFRNESTTPKFETAIFIIDTNILLAPYRASNEAFEEVIEIYTKLNNQGKLFIPAQVAREFAKNRPGVLATLHKSILNASGQSLSEKTKIAPILDADEDFEEAKRLLKESKKLLQKHKEKMELVASKVASWSLDDPVLQQYRKIFDDKNIIECRIGNEKIQDTKSKRYKSKTPPGFKDSGKDDGGIGDLIIWATILQIGQDQKKDIIFITADTKEDWFHLADGDPIFPRYELVEEYKHSTNGGKFGISNLSNLLKIMGANDKTVQEFEVSSSEAADLSFQATPMLALHPLLSAEHRVHRRLAVASGNILFDFGQGDGEIDFLVYVSGSIIAICAMDAAVFSSVSSLEEYAHEIAEAGTKYDELVFVFSGGMNNIKQILNKIKGLKSSKPLFSCILMVTSDEVDSVVVNNCSHPIMHDIFSLF